MMVYPGQILPPGAEHQVELQTQENIEFDKEFEEFVKLQKQLKAEREAVEHKKKKKRNKNANDQSDQQVEADLKP